MKAARTSWLDRIAAHFTVDVRPLPLHIGSGRNYIHACYPRRKRPRWVEWLTAYLRKIYG